MERRSVSPRRGGCVAGSMIVPMLISGLVAASCGPSVEDAVSASTTTIPAASPTPAGSQVRPTTVTTSAASALTVDPTDGVPPAEGNLWITSIAAGEAQVVAVGGVAAEFFTDAAVWTSPDGVSWSQVEADDAVFGDDRVPGPQEGHQYMTDVAVDGTDVFAVGIDGRPGEYDGAVWHSSGGMDWERHAPEAMAGPGDQIVNTIIGAPNGFIAAGESSHHAALWVSSDGVSWSLASIDGGSDALEPSTVVDLTVGGPGFVAVGGIGVELRPAVWVSADGSMWRRLPDDVDAMGSGVEGAFDLRGRMTLVAAAGSHLLAVAAETRFDWPSFGSPMIWRSTDGFEWRRVSAEFAGVPAGAVPALGAIESHGEIVYAVGGHEGLDPGWFPGKAVVWTSPDGGETWVVGSEMAVGHWADPPVPGPPGAADLVRCGSSFVVVGNDVTPTGEEIKGYEQYVQSGAVWIVGAIATD